MNDCELKTKGQVKKHAKMEGKNKRSSFKYCRQQERLNYKTTRKIIKYKAMIMNGDFFHPVLKLFLVEKG